MAVVIKNKYPDFNLCSLPIILINVIHGHF